MRYLKTFESGDSRDKFLSDDDIEDIKDIFNDLIDDYNFEIITPDTPIGKTKTITFIYRKDKQQNILEMCVLIVYFSIPFWTDKVYDTFKNDVNLICNRLEHMGYNHNANRELPPVGYTLIKIKK